MFRRYRWYRQGPFGPHAFRFRVAGPWGWGAWMGFGPWGFPRRQDYLEMLERYREELQQMKTELDEELREVEKEMEELKKSATQP
jgi:hypothetical protein